MTTDDKRQLKHIMQHVFRYLIFQSDVGLDYTEKFTAWKKVSISKHKNIIHICINIYVYDRFFGIF